MNALEILAAVEQGEADDWEFKSAKGGVPGSLWETYSAMANTQGGVIVLGVEQQGDSFRVSGIDNIAQKQKSIWDTLHNRKQVNINLLLFGDVRAMSVDGKSVIIIEVRRALRHQRPIFIGQNPLEGTYRRDNDGDYHCSADEVRRMLADQSTDPPDSRILPFLTQEHLDQNSIQQYRNRFASRDPSHPWLALGPEDFLERLGAWRRDLRSGEQGITVAGILMFGKDEIIARTEVLPGYHVDYREPSDVLSERWADRLWPDGKWVANLFQFFFECLPRLYRGLRVPFQMRDLTRIDETPAHVAIREALVNALIHADYAGKGGVVITKTRERIILENPGTLLVSYEQLQRGGVSECRNTSLQTMFGRLGMSEKAGSGMDRIREGSRYLHSLPIGVEESTNSLRDGSRVRVVFPFASMLPAESVDHLEKRFRVGLDALSPGEKLALVIAEADGEVTNRRLQLSSAEHRADLTRLLRGLVTKGFLQADKNSRPRCYHLSQSEGETARVGGETARVGGEAARVGGETARVGGESTSHNGDDLERLCRLAFSDNRNVRLTAQNIREAILRICADRYLTSAEIADVLQRNRDKLRDRYLTPLTAEGKLLLLYPSQRSHRKQGYKTKSQTSST